MATKYSLESKLTGFNIQVPDPTVWFAVRPTTSISEWDSNTSYYLSAMVYRLSTVRISLQSGNIGNDPAILEFPVYWWDIIDVYNSSITYSADSYVVYNGYVWRSLISNNVGNTPGTVTYNTIQSLDKHIDKIDKLNHAPSIELDTTPSTIIVDLNKGINFKLYIGILSSIKYIKFENLEGNLAQSLHTKVNKFDITFRIPTILNGEIKFGGGSGSEYTQPQRAISGGFPILYWVRGDFKLPVIGSGHNFVITFTYMPMYNSQVSGGISNCLVAHMSHRFPITS